MDDYEFEDQAAIQILCALLTSETYQRLANSQGERTGQGQWNPAKWAEQAYQYANALVQHRKKLAPQRPKQ